MVKVIKSESVYKDPFLEVLHEDIEINSETTIPNFSVVKKKDIVMIVATDKDENLLIVNEFKFGAQKKLWTLPAGGLKKEETPINCALRELEEETGYTSANYSLLGKVYDYPSKDRHTVYVVAARNIAKSKKSHLDETEILKAKLVSNDTLMSMIKNSEFQVSSAMAAILLFKQQT